MRHLPVLVLRVIPPTGANHPDAPRLMAMTIPGGQTESSPVDVMSSYTQSFTETGNKYQEKIREFHGMVWVAGE
jgi:hypothetical protein